MDRYQRDIAAYRAMRQQESCGPSTPAKLPRLPSLSKRVTKGALPPPPTACPPEELAESSSEGRPRASSHPAALEPPQPIASDTILDEHGAAIPVARRDSSRHVLPRAPRDVLEGACVSSRKARTTPPLASSNLLPGLSVGAAVHKPQRPAGPERRPSLPEEASSRVLFRSPPRASGPRASDRRSAGLVRATTWRSSTSKSASRHDLSPTTTDTSICCPAPCAIPAVADAFTAQSPLISLAFVQARVFLQTGERDLRRLRRQGAQARVVERQARLARSRARPESQGCSISNDL